MLLKVRIIIRKGFLFISVMKLMVMVLLRARFGQEWLLRVIAIDFLKGIIATASTVLTTPTVRSVAKIHFLFYHMRGFRTVNINMSRSFWFVGLDGSIIHKIALSII